jgi:hypothetical protein
VCQTFAVCCFYWHTAKVRFAVCPCFSTRQTFRHKAIRGFPVVNVPNIVAYFKINICMFYFRNDF